MAPGVRTTAAIAMSCVLWVVASGLRTSEHELGALGRAMAAAQLNATRVAVLLPGRAPNVSAPKKSGGGQGTPVTSGSHANGVRSNQTGNATRAMRPGNATPAMWPGNATRAMRSGNATRATWSGNATGVDVVVPDRALPSKPGEDTVGAWLDEYMPGLALPSVASEEELRRRLPTSALECARLFVMLLALASALLGLVRTSRCVLERLFGEPECTRPSMPKVLEQIHYV